MKVIESMQNSAKKNEKESKGSSTESDSDEEEVVFTDRPSKRKNKVGLYCLFVLLFKILYLWKGKQKWYNEFDLFICRLLANAPSHNHLLIMRIQYRRRGVQLPLLRKLFRENVNQTQTKLQKSVKRFSYFHIYLFI